MKVRCIKLISPQGKPLKSSPWLKLGGVYDVLSIVAGSTRGVSLRILNERGTSVFPLSDFEIVNDAIPGTWHISTSRTGDLLFEPRSWKEPGFWERFYDGDKAAQETFWGECMSMGVDRPIEDETHLDDHKAHAISTVVRADGQRRVEFFKRADGSITLAEDELTTNLDGMPCWTPIPSRSSMFDSLETAMREAQGEIDWLRNTHTED